MKDSKIGVVGIALRYPDASSPDELWRNVLAGRWAFRQLPPERMRAERMRAEDYYSTDPAAPDRHYTRMAAVLEGFEFDRVKYRIGGTTFRSTDMTHWLALDTVTRALEDAGFPGAAGLPRARTGVIIGNTLTGEFSRANLMRLRWPYVRRTVGAALKKHGWDEPQLASSPAAGISFALAGGRLLGGAVEVAAPGQAEELAAWLGTDGFTLARRLADRGESIQAAVARVKGAVESLRASGQARGPVSEAAGNWPEGWTVLQSGDMTMASFATTLQQGDSPVVFTLLARTSAS